MQLACRLGIAPSTVHRILTDAHLNRLSRVDRATGEPVRRYKHDHPGAMLHVDAKKLGNIPDGGGWRRVGRKESSSSTSAGRGRHLAQFFLEVGQFVSQPCGQLEVQVGGCLVHLLGQFLD